LERTVRPNWIFKFYYLIKDYSDFEYFTVIDVKLYKLILKKKFANLFWTHNCIFYNFESHTCLYIILIFIILIVFTKYICALTIEDIQFHIIQ
jgi:hypothetical protein